MTMRDLVLLGGGLKEGASLREAEIARLPRERTAGQTAVTIRVPLDSSYLFERSADRPYLGPPGIAVAAAGAPEVTLEPYDNVLILRQANFEYQRTITLNGEVQFPGSYALKNKREHLRDVILRAGGLTEEAQEDAIIFVRKGPTTYSVTDNTFGILSTTPVQDSLIRARATNGRIGLDLATAMRNPESRDNIVLEDGDEITILRYNPVVRVQGAVNAPANVTFVPGRDIYYYIRAAGGGARLADEGRAYVTQPSGKLESVRSRTLFSDVVPNPQAGAVVTVPERDPADRRDYVAMAGAIASIVATLVTTVVLLRRN
jgi:protein involved in polysaccharide export with SLBB domain